MDIPDNRDKTGKWIKNRFHEGLYTCSECAIQTYNKYWYCPGCGAKMDMKEENHKKCSDCYWFSDVTVQTCEKEHEPTKPCNSACDYFEQKDVKGADNA